MNTLPSAVKEAAEIADKAQILTVKLSDFAFDFAKLSEKNDQFVNSLTIFILSCFIGYYVVWKVTPALHTPLMSITNAISGIIIIGAMLAANTSSFSLSSACGYVAIFFAAVNIFGGFFVTKRMLEMFKHKDKSKF